jgi:RND family efflux transporter MFP subunit
VTRSFVFIVMLFAALAAACGGAADPEAASPPPAVQVGAENVVTVSRGTLVVGPMLSGTLRAAREARVRAELGGAVLQATAEEGQAVRQGQVLARIEARTLDDTRQSAGSAVRSAENQLAVAQREAERTEQLVSAGALAQRELDLARANVTAAEAALADARARLATAERALGDAVIRAPFSGVVAARPVNVGDIVSPGTELFTIIDPSSMRLEAAVPSDDLRALRVGLSVRFRVRGYDEEFEGRIDRIAPQADPSTRQVPIFVAIPNTSGRLVAGLFAEGRVVSDSADGLIVPINAVNTTGESDWVLKVTDGRTERVEVTVGLTDRRTEQVQIASGVSEGDVLLRGAAQGITPGTEVQVGGE